MGNWRKYMLWFAQEHVEFRSAEISSILKTLCIPIKYPENHQDERPFWLVELPNDHSARLLASRSISLRCIIEHWSHATSFPAFHRATQQYIAENPAYVAYLCGADKSFKITVETFNRHLSQPEKIEKIESIGYLPARGKVDLRNPDVSWVYFEYYGTDALNTPSEPYDIIFGKWVADGRRSMLKDISLKTRKFIGNTSMDPQLSVLMANQALIAPGHLVLDPFVGTGSLLVPAAKFGAFVMGTDIDFMMLHARNRPSRVTQKKREQDESIRANLRQYNCEQQYVDVAVSDFSRDIWRTEFQFDSIITDPPYGIREATEKVEAKQKKMDTTPRNEDEPQFPSTSNYDLSELYADLLQFAVKHLKLGGRLVCWIPIFKKDYKESITIPRHNCLHLIANSEQNISSLTSRRLLTYEKILEPNADADISSSEEVVESVGDFRSKFFSYEEESRQERRMRKAEIKEIGRQEALNRGKRLDENGKVTSKLAAADSILVE